MNYEYPLDYSLYSKEEIIKIIDFFAYIEDNLKSLDKETLKIKYNVYRNIINSKAEEKKIEKEFLKVSGISIYEILKKFGL